MIRKKKKKSRQNLITKLRLFGSKESREILKTYFLPLVRELKSNNEITFTQALKYLLGDKTRRIDIYKIDKPIGKFPGLFALAGARFCEGRGLRQVGTDWYLFARFDERAPDIIDVELFKKFEDEISYSYRLTPGEFRSIVDNIRKIEL